MAFLFSPAGIADAKSLDDVSLKINEGEFVLVCGETGSGKTTLLRQLKKQIRPHGSIDGEVLYDGLSIDNLNEERAVTEIGMVFQNPDNQIVMDSVWHELAFSLENIGCDIDEMRKRIGEMANFFGLNSIMNKSVHELSGGQKQLLNLASVLLLKPKVLLLDEPISQLDPISANEFLKMLRQLNEELSITIIMSEHRLDDVFAMADKVIVVEKGKVKYEQTPKTICKLICDRNNKALKGFLPVLAKMYLSVEENVRHEDIPLTVKEAKRWAAQRKWVGKKVEEEDYNSSCIIKCSNVYFKYDKHGDNIIQGLSLDIYKGEFLSIVGGNGSGKSTLLRIIAGLLKPQKGKIYISSDEVLNSSIKKRTPVIGYLDQNPMLYFTHSTVRDEIFEYAKNQKDVDYSYIDKLIKIFNLEYVMDKHPYDISHGQKQKLALITVLFTKPDILLFDEPTKGLDPESKKEFEKILSELKNNGKTIVVVTHDIEFAASNSDRCAMIFGGEITSNQKSNKFFAENFFYTTHISKTTREYIPNLVTFKDVISFCS